MSRKFFFLVDGLTRPRAERLRRALEHAAGVNGVTVRPDHGLVEVRASGDPEAQVKMACSIVGAPFRVRLKKRDLS